MRIVFVLFICFYLASCTFVRKVASKTSFLKRSIQSVSQKQIDQTSAKPVQANNYLDPIYPVQNLPVLKNENVAESRSFKASSPVSAPSILSRSGLQTHQVDPVLFPMTPPSSLQFKYAQILGQDIAQLPDSLLLQQIDPWLGVRYRNGGNTAAGIDCSAFTATILLSYRGIQLPRTSREQFRFCEQVNKSDLQVGDLLFFRTRGRSISHVGIYLGNDKFVHASSSNGVMVSDSKESYFSARYVGAGRIPQSSVTTE
jgi:lipoprotein Spr